MKRKKKRLRIIVLSFLVILGGCAALPEEQKSANGEETSKETLLDPKKPVSVHLWHYYAGENKQALENAASEFNRSIGIDRGVIVTPVAKGSILDLEMEITASAKGEAGAEVMPEMFSSYLDKAMEIDALGKLEDFNRYFDEGEKERYFAKYLRSSLAAENRFLILPIVKSTEILYVNKQGWERFAEENGISPTELKTWEGLLRTARAYYQWQDAKTPRQPWDGKGFMGMDVLSNFIFVGSTQLGVDIMDRESGKVRLDEPSLRRLYEIYAKGMALGYFDASGKYRSDNIKSGDLIAYIGSSSGAPYFPSWIEKDSGKESIELLAKPYPVFEGGRSRIVLQGAGVCLSTPDLQKQEGAVLFLKWFTGREQNARFAMSTGYFPVNAAPYDEGTTEGFFRAMGAESFPSENVRKVYEVSFDQLMEAEIYETPFFEKSYELRKFFEHSLMMQAQKMEEDAVKWKQDGLTEEEILTNLDMDARFHSWLDELRGELKSRGIPYEETF